MDDIETVVLLANSGADVNAADDKGTSVLMHVINNLPRDMRMTRDAR